MSRQLSGFNIFAFLSNTFISNAEPSGTYEISQMRSLWLSFGFALANALWVLNSFPAMERPTLIDEMNRFSPLAYFTIDSRGRRFLLLLSLTLMVPLLIAAGFSLRINPEHPDNKARVGVFEVFLLIYTAAYSPGAGVVPFLYSSEIFPLLNRGK